ncbi:hypothetical protein PHLCEN_2v9694 [Hermanssonia centrifuga]|uniref:Uncharacterized protein n=1 Tax=Hermanssonia centrifuga TaxID=98765 RepID=A0A2R6NQ78_9APHY|nr:hypothetical protein PHLCEN_2v9694 [Hermanssonia centrifuga]
MVRFSIVVIHTISKLTPLEQEYWHTAEDNALSRHLSLAVASWTQQRANDAASVELLTLDCQ